MLELSSIFFYFYFQNFNKFFMIFQNKITLINFITYINYYIINTLINDKTYILY